MGQKPEWLKWFTSETPLQLMLLSRNKERCAEISKCLRKAGVDSITTVKSAVQARKLLRKQTFHGLIFDRELIDDYDLFFEAMDLEALWFIPVAAEKDNYDVIAALNTGRAAYYLVPPFSAEQAGKAVSSLRMRIMFDTAVEAS